MAGKRRLQNKSRDGRLILIRLAIVDRNMRCMSRPDILYSDKLQEEELNRQGWHWLAESGWTWST